jgi:hypothetical protein
LPFDLFGLSLMQNYPLAASKSARLILAAETNFFMHSSVLKRDLALAQPHRQSVFQQP